MRHHFRLPKLLVLAVGLGAAPALAEDTPDAAALIATVPAKQGTIPDIITAYGSAAPALEGGEAVSLAQDGRVAGIFVTPGERVRRGDRLLSFDLAATAVSAYAQAVAAYNLAVSQRSHTTQLLAQRLATRDQLAQAENALANARAALDALRRQGGGQPRTELIAAFDGVIDAIPVAIGERVAAGAPLIRLIRTDGASGPAGLVVTVGVAVDQASRVQTGQSAVLHRFDSNATLNGRVLRVNGMMNPKSHLVDVDIGVPQAGLLAGETFAAAITIGSLAGWLVPHDAVLSDEKGEYLFQSDGSHAHRVDVQTLGTQGNTDAVSGKLIAKMLVITDGAPQLADGDPVRTAP